MKQWVLHILSTAWLIGVLSSCTNLLDEESSQQADKVEVSFTLSMQGGMQSRATLTEDSGNEYENTIDINNKDIKVFICKGTNYSEVQNLMISGSNGTYWVNGVITGIAEGDKVMVFANCGEVNPSLAENLIFSYAAGDYQPAGNKYIPMWGVKSISGLKKGENNLGTIDLLRAMAKVRVRLSSESNATLESVSFSHYNSSGIYLPDGYAAWDSTGQVENPTIPHDVTKGGELSFHQLAASDYVIYLPEYQNKEAADKAEIKLRMIDVNGQERDYSVPFQDIQKKEDWDILRNHYYEFIIRLTVEEDNFKVTVEPAMYDSFELEPVYGDDLNDIK